MRRLSEASFIHIIHNPAFADKGLREWVLWQSGAVRQHAPLPRTCPMYGCGCLIASRKYPDNEPEKEADPDPEIACQGWKKKKSLGPRSSLLFIFIYIYESQLRYVYSYIYTCIIVYIRGSAGPSTPLYIYSHLSTPLLGEIATGGQRQSFASKASRQNKATTKASTTKPPL